MATNRDQKANLDTRKQDPQARRRVALSKALAHPLRETIYRMVVDRKKGISPNRIAKKVGEPVSNVSYHVRVLAGIDAILCIETTAVRGSTEHFYVVNPADSASDRTRPSASGRSPIGKV